MPEAYIYDVVRTPFGKKKGGLSKVHPGTLGAHCLSELVHRNKINPIEIEDVIMGCVTQTKEQGTCIARQSVLEAGWPVEVPGTTINRFCGSGLQACNFTSQAVMSGTYDLAIGGGVENMSIVGMGSDLGAMAPEMLKRFPGLIPQGLSAEMVADQWDLPRSLLDEFAARSQETAATAWDRGFFKKGLVKPMMGINKEGEPALIEKDEHPRPGSTAEKLAALIPVFKPNGKIHAGNSSGIVDGAAQVLIGNREVGKRLGLKPRAKITVMTAVGTEPVIMLTGPIPAIQKAFKKTGLGVKDISIFEINEAFASVPLATMKELGIPLAKVNPNGGAIAIGHPLGATGAALVGACLTGLEEKDERYGLITLCIGFGMGVATIIDRKVD